MADLQEGIYHAPGQAPGRAFGILFLRAAPGRSAGQVGEALRRLWGMYQDLKAGKVRELPGHPVPSGDLTVLVGYGPKAFQVPGARRVLPQEFGPAFRFRSARPTGGGPLLLGAGLHYDDDVRTNPATEELAVQLIAQTQLAVNRAIVETWRTLEEVTDPVSGESPLLLTSFYGGFQRDDGRSWLGFHDGVSNMKSSERYGAIAIKPSGAAADAWTVGGTYLAFARLAVDLASWQRLSRQQQEQLVGRDKLTGCALVAAGAGSGYALQPGCPIAGSREVTERGNERFREAPEPGDSHLRMSHIQRANHRQDAPASRNSLRIFRQGYEFLEPHDRAPGFRAGLNFVSFQDTPERLFRLLTTPGWLGRTNFGGDEANPLPGTERLLTVRAAGVYLVPPRADGEYFPGSSIWL
jgi:Dyp-type peroxidase family